MAKTHKKPSPLRIHLKLPKKPQPQTPPAGPSEPSEPIRAPSPEWNCEHGDLPKTDEEDADVTAISSQQSNAHSSRWLPWQDRRLIREVNVLRPFQEPAGTATREAWDRLAKQLLKDSSQEGPQSRIDRSGNACRQRFERLVAKHRKDETRSLQSTGTNEEIDEHIEILTNLVSLIDDLNDARATKSKKKQEKTSLEDEASWQLREASMNGLVRGASLVDVSTLPGASTREKQAQRGTKRRSAPIPESSDDKENLPLSVLPRKRPRNEVKAMLSEHITADKKVLQDLQALDQARHEELTGLQRESIEALRGVQTLLEAQQQRDLERHNEELHHRLEQKEQQAALTTAILNLSVILSKKS